MKRFIPFLLLALWMVGCSPAALSEKKVGDIPEAKMPTIPVFIETVDASGKPVDASVWFEFKAEPGTAQLPIVYLTGPDGRMTHNFPLGKEVVIKAHADGKKAEKRIKVSKDTGTVRLVLK
jgi:hypothetical protein